MRSRGSNRLRYREFRTRRKSLHLKVLKGVKILDEYSSVQWFAFYGSWPYFKQRSTEITSGISTTLTPTDPFF
ncbi:hypothetical protein Trydic_g18459 [Trypoxylus dichotomus]